MNIKPCGGCGETNPNRRCLGCFHQFYIIKIIDKYKITIYK